ncbi:lipid transfer-like protein [Musa troglodytarum]|uniref:Lipid transfer-like protein n=1 Tax=Musa troglodytarum TaxID=320322 RepID=A0A9E7FRG6_9LILI|nr:lipid transfer-like protein [Musa troglodytarum]
MGVDFAAGVMAMAVVAVAVVAAAVAGSAAQSPPDCASNLVGCAGYLTSTTTPPDSCCGPLKLAAKSELPCLCSLFNNTAILRAFNVNITQAIQMSKRCGVSTDQRACATAAASGTTATPSSSKNNTGSSVAKDSSSANRATSVGLPGLVSLLLCWWSLMA